MKKRFLPVLLIVPMVLAVVAITDEALAGIGESVRRIRGECSPDAIAMYVGTAAGFSVLPTWLPPSRLSNSRWLTSATSCWVSAGGPEKLSRRCAPWRR